MSKINVCVFPVSYKNGRLQGRIGFTPSAEEPPALSLFDWPKVLEAFLRQARIDGAKLETLSVAPDLGLFRALIPPTTPHKTVARKAARPRFESVGDALEPETNTPLSAIVADRHDRLMSLAASLRGPSFVDAEEIEAAMAAPAFRAVSRSASRLGETLEKFVPPENPAVKPGSRPQRVPLPPGRTAQDEVEEENDFFRLWSAIYDKPELALKCGILVDFAAPVAGGATSVGVTLDPLDLLSLKQRFGLSFELFRTAIDAAKNPAATSVAAKGWELVGGLLDLSKADVATIDSMGETLKSAMADAALRGAGVPELGARMGRFHEAKVPTDVASAHRRRADETLRSTSVDVHAQRPAGFYVSLPNASDQIRRQDKGQQDALGAVKGEESLLDLHQLVEGYAVYGAHSRDGSVWSEPMLLSADRGEYEVYDEDDAVVLEDTVPFARLRHNDPVAVTQGTTTPVRDRAAHLVSDVLFSYVGMPIGEESLGGGVDLTAPIDGPGSPRESKAFRMRAVHEGGRVLPLVYGVHYRFGARAVTAAGTMVGPEPTKSSFRRFTEGDVFMRAHPVGKPVVRLRSTTDPNQSVEQVVVYGEDLEDGKKAAQRWVLPPRTSAEELMRYGVVDYDLLGSCDAEIDEASLQTKDPAAFRLPYPADPCAEGVRFSARGDDGSIDSIDVSFYDDPKSSKVKPILFQVLRSKDPLARPRFNLPKREKEFVRVELYLPVATRLELDLETISRVPESARKTKDGSGKTVAELGEHFYLVGLHNRVDRFKGDSRADEKRQRFDRELVRQTTSRTSIACVHAVAQPVTLPGRTTRVTSGGGSWPERRYKDTSIPVDLETAFLLRSVERIDLVASNPDPGPFEDHRKSPTRKERTVVGRALEYPVDPKKANDLATTQIIDDFGDTKHYLVDYRAEATSRFASFYRKRSEPTRAVRSEPSTIRVVSTDRPSPIKIRSAYPAYRTVSKPEGASWKHECQACLRLEVEGGWNESGIEEGIGLLLLRRAEAGNVQPAVPEESRADLVTRFARDLMDPHLLEDVPDPQLSPTCFKASDGRWINQRLAEGGYAFFHFVRFAAMAYVDGAWIADVELDGIEGYYPFVDLYAVRMQEFSYHRVEDSAVVQPHAVSEQHHFGTVRVAPGRTVYVERESSGARPTVKVRVVSNRRASDPDNEWRASLYGGWRAGDRPEGEETLDDGGNDLWRRLALESGSGPTRESRWQIRLSRPQIERKDLSVVSGTLVPGDVLKQSTLVLTETERYLDSDGRPTQREVLRLGLSVSTPMIAGLPAEEDQ